MEYTKTMSKIYKKLLVGIGVCAIILSLTGCTNARIQRTINTLEKKYGETFTYHGARSGMVATDGLVIYLVAEDYPDTPFWVQNKWVNGKQVITDGFMGVKYREETGTLLQETIEEVTGADVVIGYSGNSTAMPEGASGDMTFEEYISLPSSQIGFYAITSRQCNSEAEQEELEKKLEEAFVEQGICCTDGRVYFDNGEGHFEELQNGELIDGQYIISEYASCHIQFEMEDTTGFSSVVWKEN